jgi:hypothetical protein
MTQLTAFLLTIAAHILCDFVFQGSRLSSKKRFLNSYMLAHGISVSFACSFIYWTYYQTLYSFMGSFLVVLTTHIAIDSIKVFLSKRFKHPNVLLGLDQLFHICVLYLLFLSF